MKTQQAITVRRPELFFPECIDPVLLEAEPELSYALVGISLSLPYIEPYLIRTLSAARRQVSDPVLLEQIRLLNAQEGQHVRLHARFNEAVRERSPELAALESELAADCRRFTETRSLQWNLAYVVGVEAFTVALSDFLFEEQLLRDAPPAVRDLFEWHIVEELEHRAVAFDVYQHLYGGYPLRAAVGLYAQWHFCRFALRAAGLMLARDRARGRDHGGPARSRPRIRALLGSMARGMLPYILSSYSPRYRPHDLPIPAGSDAVLERIAGRGAEPATARGATWSRSTAQPSSSA
jgi:predicted metal-dependent hydrolase